MKKIFALLLMLCLLAAVVSSFAVNAAAEDVEISIGQRYEWNDQSQNTEDYKTWVAGGGVSPDNLWFYKIFVLKTEKYMPVVYSNSIGCYAWALQPGDTGIGFARVRSKGVNFHPGEAGDIVKGFICPSGGTVTLETTVARSSEYNLSSSSATPTSFAVYLANGFGASNKAENKVKVYPADDNFEVLTSIDEKTISVDIDVKQGQVILIHIGAMEEQSADSVNMSNYVTYTAINNDVADELTDIDTGKDIPTRTDSIPTLNNGSNNISSGTVNGNTDGGSSLGLILGVVAGVVVVAAVAVVILMKKKKSE